ncbi:MAG: SDR family oxidoreductase [Candidatus Obscuribacterales bacterium]|nr:SDR family oxidoreductase [Candidatus Obscuribacterales bacterium]
MTEGGADMERVLVLGATGYVGTRLVSRLLADDREFKIRVCSRSREKLEGRAWAKDSRVEIMEADVLDRESLARAVQGCDQAFYLVHSMNASSNDFASCDREAARNMVDAASRSELKHIIYLGGLGEDSPDLSKHLRSRSEVGRILRSGSVPVTTLRAAMIIGSGSASFEILRYLVDRLPLMITPRWVSMPTQPVAIANVLNYLSGCLDLDLDGGAAGNRTFDIGGPEVITYKELMKIYAEEAGLSRRCIIPVPVFTPRLSSYWIHLVTPVPACLGRPLAEGLRNPTICTNNDIKELIPQDLYSCRKAIRLALDRMQHHQVESHWTDAGKIWPVAWSNEGDARWAGGTVYEDRREVLLDATAAEVWRPVIRLGGETGYYYADWLWRLRGVLDKLAGGVGLRRGRRSPESVSPGDVLDFWRVRHVEPCRHLSLVAEMRLPGEAVLEFRIEERPDGRTRLTQVAKFLPSGLLGIAYWKLISPLHDLVFHGMLKGLAEATSCHIVQGPIKSLPESMQFQARCPRSPHEPLAEKQAGGPGQQFG